MPHPQSARRRTLAAALFLLAWGAAAPAAFAAEEEATSLLARANEQLEERRFGMAAETARRVMALGPPVHVAAQAANVLGLALYRHWSLGLEDASDERLKWLLNPSRPAIPITQPGEEVLAEAVEAFRRAVELDPDGGNPLRQNLAQALYDLGRAKEAKAVIAEYVRRGGKHPDALALDACLDPPTAGDETGAGTLRVGGEVARPEKIAGDNPSYNDLARALGIQGIVILEAIIDETGEVRCLHPSKRQPIGLTDAAMQAVRTWKFKPATLEGKPVKVHYTLTVNFMVRHRPPRPG